MMLLQIWGGSQRYGWKYNDDINGKWKPTVTGETQSPSVLATVEAWAKQRGLSCDDVGWTLFGDDDKHIEAGGCAYDSAEALWEVNKHG